MLQTAIWIAPSLCGCRIKMTAEFKREHVIGGEAHPHPKDCIGDPSIAHPENLEIIHVCDEHLPYAQAMIDTSIFFEEDKIDGGMKQVRGYLRYPIEHPSPAECLYTFLSTLIANAEHLSCGCRGYFFSEDKINRKYVHHTIHSKKCFLHKDDDHEMTAARLYHNKENTAHESS